MKNFSLILLLIFAGGLALAQTPVCVPEKAQNPGEYLDTGGETDKGQLLKPGTEGSYFYTKATFEGQPGKVYYKNAVSDKENILFDPLMYRNDAMYYVHDLFPNHNATRLAILLSAAHLPGLELIVVNLEGEILDKGLAGISGYGFSWLPDGEHFLYHRLNGEKDQDTHFWKSTATMLHALGSTQEEDREYFSARTATANAIHENELPVAIYCKQLNGVIGKVIYPDNTMSVYLKQGDPLTGETWTQLASAEDLVADLYLSRGYIYYKTALEADGFKIVTSMVRWPEFSNADLIVPEFPGEKITDFLVNREGIYVVTRNQEQEYTLKFRPRRYDLYDPANPKLFKSIRLPGNPEEIRFQLDQPDGESFWIRVTDEWAGEIRFKYNSKDGSLIRWNETDQPGIF